MDAVRLVDMFWNLDPSRTTQNSLTVYKLDCHCKASKSENRRCHKWHRRVCRRSASALFNVTIFTHSVHARSEKLNAAHNVEFFSWTQFILRRVFGTGMCVVSGGGAPTRIRGFWKPLRETMNVWIQARSTGNHWLFARTMREARLTNEPRGIEELARVF